MLSPMRPRVGVSDVFDEFAMVDPYTAEPVDLALLGITPATAADAAGLQPGMHPTSTVIPSASTPAAPSAC